MPYRERLTTPPWYWLVGIAFGVTSVVAMSLWLGNELALGAGLVAVALLTTLLLWWGRTEIVVEPGGVRVGDSVLEWRYVGEVEVLDADATRGRLGADADARAFVVQRPWIAESVVIEVRDEADPHPYWLVSTRRPHHVADAVARAREAAA